MQTIRSRSIELTSEPSLKRCQLGNYLSCSLNEECVPFPKGSNQGLCKCKQGFNKNKSQSCTLSGKSILLNFT